jgi:hypothetical protein
MKMPWIDTEAYNTEMEYSFIKQENLLCKLSTGKDLTESQIEQLKSERKQKSK